MLTNVCAPYHQLIHFLKNHQTLTYLTLGALVIFAFGKLGPRLVAWIRQKGGTTSKVNSFSEPFLKRPIDRFEPSSQKLDPLNPVILPTTLSPTKKYKTDFIRRMVASEPELHPCKKGKGIGLGYGKLQADYTNRQVEVFINFFKVELAQTDVTQIADLTYLCIGAGSCKDQIWPGFVFEALEKNLKIKTLFIEVFNHYSTWAVINDFTTHYQRYLKAVQKDNFLDPQDPRYANMSMHQFLCGFPGLPTADSDPLYSSSKYDTMLSSRWPTEALIKQATDLIDDYIDWLLSNGKQVVLGWHCCGNLEIKPLYNKFVTRYPGQIYYLIAHEGANSMTNKPLPSSQLALVCPPQLVTNKTNEWVHFGTDLGNCVLSDKRLHP